MKDRNILAIKGLAIIGVILHHLLNRRHDPHTIECLKILLMASNWCVLAFVCVSGYLHASSDSRRRKSVAEFTLLRFNRLIVPWLLLILAFSLIWQTLQAMHVSGIAVKVPLDFMGKIFDSVWPIRTTVGEQLYYLPLLFGASVIFVIVRAALGLPGVWVLTLISFVVAQGVFPLEFTGFLPGVFIWSVCFYAAGYLLFNYRDKVPHIRLTLVVCTAILVFFSGHFGVIHSVPLWMIAEGGLIGLPAIPGLQSVGEASGTIYIYHTPFILQPMVIMSTHLSGAVPQLIGALTAGFIAGGICYLFHHLVKNTRAKILLM